MKVADVTHTPGPWDDASKYPGADSVRIFAKTHYIATVGNSDDPREVTEANARLIAAAPTLLAAARDAVAFLDTIDWTDTTSEHDGANAQHALEAAIAKAEGRS